MVLATKNTILVAKMLPKNGTGDQKQIFSSQLANKYFSQRRALRDHYSLLFITQDPSDGGRGILRTDLEVVTLEHKPLFERIRYHIMCSIMRCHEKNTSLELAAYFHVQLNLPRWTLVLRVYLS